MYLVAVSPFTQTLATSEVPQIFIPKAKEEQMVKSAVKLLESFFGFALANKMDGILLEGNLFWQLLVA